MGVFFFTHVSRPLSRHRVCRILFDRRIGGTRPDRGLDAVVGRPRAPGSRIGEFQNLLVHDVATDRAGFYVTAHHPDTLDGPRVLRAIQYVVVHGVFRDLATLRADRICTSGHRESNDWLATRHFTDHVDCEVGLVCVSCIIYKCLRVNLYSF